LYAPRQYYDRVRAFLREYKPPRIQFHLELQHVLAFFRSVYHLGIRSEERAEYWRLVGWTLLHRPALFPLAITLAIYGFHFRQVFRLYVA